MFALVTTLCVFTANDSAVFQVKKTALPIDPQQLEKEILNALAASKPFPFDQFAKKIARLSECQRRTLLFRVRPGAVEFRFTGECPGHKNIEFIVSNKLRDYESLLVLNKTELARAERVWKVYLQLAIAKRNPVLDYKLLWVEKNKPRVENLDDVFRKRIWSVMKKAQVYRWLDWEDHGLRIPNIGLDPATVPATRQPAQMIFILRLDSK